MRQRSATTRASVEFSYLLDCKRRQRLLQLDRRKMHTARGTPFFASAVLCLLWSTGLAQDSCTSQTTCGDCIQFTSTQCQWCSQLVFPRIPRCSQSFTQCTEIQNPEGGIDSSTEPPSQSNINPVSPLKYTVSLRPGISVPIEINVTTIRNVPLDVYLLFDISASMAEEVAAVARAVRDIVDRLSRITSDVLLGFGGFSDKPLRPYTILGTDAGKEQEICGTIGDCVDYRHFGPLTSNATELERRINTTVSFLSRNLDAPESGLEALGQVALCTEQVGWRDNSVKVVLYWSDDALHIAGEGRFAGIFKPYIEECQLEGDLARDGYLDYAGSTTYDYPSVGQVLSLLQRRNIFPVFIAVTTLHGSNRQYDVFTTHQILEELFNRNFRASSAQITQGDNETETVLQQNILNTIDNEVQEILRRTGLTPPSIDGISFSVSAVCPEGATKSPKGDFCTNVTLNTKTRFTVTMTLESCDQFDKTASPFPIQVLPVGVVMVNVTAICRCSCEENVDVASMECSGNGNFSCGVCICDPGWCGNNCSVMVDATTSCPEDDGKICSGTGRGSCQTCECICDSDLTVPSVIDPRLNRPGVRPDTFGLACECDYFRCLDFDNQTHTVVCSGRGTCCSGQCVCDLNADRFFYRNNPNTDLADCDCEPEEIVCRANRTDLTCGGRGTCLCSTCQCKEPYGGNFCQNVEHFECNSLTTDVTNGPDNVRECVLSEKRETDSSLMSPNCSNIRVQRVILIPESAQPSSNDRGVIENEIAMFASQQLGSPYDFQAQCSFDEKDCTHSFYYVTKRSNISIIVIVAEVQNECPIRRRQGVQLGIPLWALAIILLVALLVIGAIVLILIKVLFMILDYFEVKRLEKEVKMADFSKNQNPLYQSPEMEYKNVAYGKE